MTCNRNDIFNKTDALLSINPRMPLRELAKRLSCSHPTIRSAILKHTMFGFREYRNRKLLEKGKNLLRQRYTVKEVSIALGYMWPENFTRFTRKTIGLSASEIK
jgi:methylphosphotriester-DNA--protein-cysteine methyltransferase